MADCAFYESRYAIPTYGLVVIFAGFGLNFIDEKTVQFVKKQHLFKVALLITLFLSLYAYWYFNDYQPYLFKGSYRDYLYNKRSVVDDYSRLNNLLKGIPKENSYFFVPHANEEEILRFLGYQVSSLSEMKAFQQFDRADFTTAKLPLDMTKNNYFIQSWYCQTLIELRTLCEFVKENYKLKLIKQTNYDSFYSFINED